MEDIISRIKDLPIDRIIERDVKLTKSGANFKGCCPFHDEKTPSFIVSPTKGIYKCFGCGEGGDIIKYIEKKKSLDFISAVKLLCSDFSIPFPENIDYDPEKEIKRKSLLEVLELCQKFFEKSLYEQSGSDALKYIENRFDRETLQLYGIGYAPAGNKLISYLKSKSVTESQMKEIGVIGINDNKEKYDFFRDRVIFPIRNQRSQVIAFSGRAYKGDDKGPKYLNSPETDLFSKKNVLFGIDTALTEIRRSNNVYLVEGNPDVITMQRIGINNTVAILGTGMTSGHVETLTKIAKTITIVGDSDKAGIISVNKSAEKIIKESAKLKGAREAVFVNVIMLPTDQGKVDPDSFFKNVSFFKEYENEHKEDYIEYKASLAKDNWTSDITSEYIKDLCLLIFNYNEASRSLYVEKISKYLKPKKAITDELKRLDSEVIKQEKAEKVKLPSHVNHADVEIYGFYADNNCYYFRQKLGYSSGQGYERGSNFVMEPLFHVVSTFNSKRLYSITNEYGIKHIIELAQADLVSLQKFKLRVESMGNFLWEAGETELNRVKKYIYEKTKTCDEITQLGWQKDGFWAWANGIFHNGTYTKVNEYGIVTINDKNYYIPAYSEIYKNDDSLFMSERKFIHMPSSITLKELTAKFIDVYGNNGKIAFGFYFAALFRDIIMQKFGFFPILNLFGSKGTGKSEMALLMLKFFGKLDKGPNIQTTSKAALADHVSQTANAICHIDEYKNSVEYEKVEFLKGVWDGTGRTRMNMDKDKKKETTAVDCALTLSGQEMPMIDVALFSRVISLIFTKDKYTEQEKAKFDELKEIFAAGVTHITHQILAYRKAFVDLFINNYYECHRDINDILGDETIEDRIYKNWSILFACIKTLEPYLDLSFTYQETLQDGVKEMIRQNNDTKKSNDIANFWVIFEFLVKENELIEDVDYIIKYKDNEITDKTEYNFGKKERILYILHNSVFIKYQRHGKHVGGNTIPIPSLEHYLKNSKEYLGRKTSIAFKKANSTYQPDIDGTAKLSRNVTSGMVFLLDRIIEEYSINIVAYNLNDTEAENFENQTKLKNASYTLLHSPTTPQQSEDVPF